MSVIHTSLLRSVNATDDVSLCSVDASDDVSLCVCVVWLTTLYQFLFSCCLSPSEPLQFPPFKPQSTVSVCLSVLTSIFSGCSVCSDRQLAVCCVTFHLHSKLTESQAVNSVCANTASVSQPDAQYLDLVTSQPLTTRNSVQPLDRPYSPVCSSAC